MVRQVCGGAVGAAALVVQIFFGAEVGHAVPIVSPTKTYTIDGGGFNFTLDKAGTTNDLMFAGTAKPSSTVTTGPIVGDTLTYLLSNMSLDFTIYSDDAQTAGGVGNKIGSATGTLSVAYSNLKYNAGKDVAGGIPGKSAGGGLVVSLNGNINGQSFVLAAPLMTMAAHILPGSWDGRYDNAIAGLGNDLFLAFGNVGRNFEHGIDGWLAGDTFLLGSAYHLAGDIHASLKVPGGGGNPIPEPTTMSLLGLGTLAAAAKSRRRKTA